MGRDGQPWSVCSAAQATTLIQPVSGIGKKIWPVSYPISSTSKQPQIERPNTHLGSVV